MSRLSFKLFDNKKILNMRSSLLSVSCSPNKGDFALKSAVRIVTARFSLSSNPFGDRLG